MAYTDLLELALLLPESKRAELACRIILSLSPDLDRANLARPRISLEEVVKKRTARIVRGEYKSYSIDETMARVRSAMQRELTS
jgi:hypothetical protein